MAVECFPDLEIFSRTQSLGKKIRSDLDNWHLFCYYCFVQQTHLNLHGLKTGIYHFYRSSA